MNILLTSVSNKVSLIKAFKKAVANKGKVYGMDMSSNAAALYFCDDYAITLPLNDASHMEQLNDYCDAHQIDLVIPTRDEDLWLYSKQLFTYSEAMVASDNTITTCYDKQLFYEFCKKNNFPTPKIYDSHVDLPCIVKKRCGSGSDHVRLVENRECLSWDIDEIAQEYVLGAEWTVDLFVDFSGNVISVVPRVREKVKAGESIITTTKKNDNLIAFSMMLAQKLKLIGHNNIQFIEDSNSSFGHKVLEVNPRFGGGSVLSFEAGCNSPEFLVTIMEGGTVEPCIGNYKTELTMLRYSQDIFLPQFIDETEQKTYCFDLDGTICTEGCKYEDAMPNINVIKKINNLEERGNIIVIYTARGCQSGQDWKELTLDQLQKWGVKYARVMFDKPYADYYIDNKSINILDWT